MSAARERPQVVLRPVAVDRETAASALGVGISTFGERIQPELRVVRLGSKVLIPVAELERWCERRAELTIPKAI